MTYRRAALADVRALAADWPDDYLECRIIGHAWINRTINRLTHTLRITRHCARCHAVLTVTAYDTGHIETRTVTYPDDYLTPPGTGHVVGTGMDVVRKEQITRDQTRRAHPRKGTTATPLRRNG